MSTAIIGKSTARGAVSAPPSKSYAHRLLLAAFLSGKKVTISNIALSNDISATIGCLRALGAAVSVDGDRCTVEPGTAAGNAAGSGILDCGESGSTLRFFIPVVMALRGKAHLTGTPKLFSRGIGEYEKIFANQGIKYTLGPDSLVADGALKSGVFRIDGSVSSQFITGLLFALPLLEGDSEIWIAPPVTSRPYIDITLDVLRNAGVEVKMAGNHITVPGGQRYNLTDCTVEGDWSNAAFLDIYNYLGGEVTVGGLKADSLQGDRIYRQLFARLERGYCSIDISNCIDLGPVLFTLAALKHGARFTGCARLRIKESDRVADMVAELAKAGACATVGEDSVVIQPLDRGALEFLSGCVTFDSHNDHRLAMCLTALASTFGARVAGCEAVAKSYPDFYKIIRTLSVDARYE